MGSISIEQDRVVEALRVQKALLPFARANALEVMSVLARQPYDVGTIAKELSLDMVAISKCVRQLADHRWLKMERDGRYHIYSLADSIEVTQCDGRVCMCINLVHDARLCIDNIACTGQK